MESEMSASDDLIFSLQKVLFAALQLLHERGTLPMQDVAAKLESEMAFSTGAFDRKPPQLLGSLIAMLRSVGDTIDETRSAGPSSDRAQS